MSQAGAKALRRRAVDQMAAEHARELAEKVFRPALREQIVRAKAAEERAAILQTVVERIALVDPACDPVVDARLVLEQLGIVPDVQTEANGG